MRELDEVLARHSGPSNWNGGSMAVRCDEDAGLAMKADDEPKAEAQPGPAPSVTAPGTQLLSAFAVLRVADVLASRKLPASSLQRSALGDTIVVAIWKSGTGEFLNVVFACLRKAFVSLEGRPRTLAPQPTYALVNVAGLSTLEQSGERGHATLCFRFESVNSCVQRFLRAWETTFLISHLALQVIDNHQDHVTVTDWSAKRLVVGCAHIVASKLCSSHRVRDIFGIQEYTMEVTVCQLGNPPTAYRPQGKRRGRYKVVFGRRSAAGSQLRTPHLPFQHYVEDKLDRSHNLDRLFAYLIPTLPLLTEIERQTEENPNPLPRSVQEVRLESDPIRRNATLGNVLTPAFTVDIAGRVFFLPRRFLAGRHCLDVRVLVFEPWKTGFLLLSDVTTPQPYEAGAEPASAGDAGLGRSVEKSAGSKYKPIPDASAQLKELAAGTAQSNPKESTAQPAAAAAAAAAAATTPTPSSNDGMVRVLQGKVICSARMAPEVYRVLLEVIAKPREGSAGPAA
ncbi:MAG: hypothetical protein BJ554DRAFT_3920 [Olpidium bornovanus]|uniref:Uncharacterized protein n=1 Tax=Olpidium bornovanus TaxID=278681 RepID=A0A8H7ZNG2_9FUNG|nr:MAG: hypothetical protein BJ554DRAFT_3920 [Olpidium bornovanus]